MHRQNGEMGGVPRYMAKKKPKTHLAASKSALLTLMYQGLEKLGRRFADSAVIRFLVSYDEMEDYASSSMAVGGVRQAVTNLKKKFSRKPRRERGTEQITPKEVGIFAPGSLPRSLKNRISEAAEGSVILRKTAEFLQKLLYMPMMYYGVFLFSFGLFTTVSQAMLYFWLRSNDVAAALDLFVGLTLVLLSLLVMFKGYDPMMDSLRESIAGRFVIRMMNDRTMPELPRKKHHSAGLFFAAGMLLGLFTLITPPLWLISRLLFVILALCVFFVPEAGVCALLFALPFLITFSVSAQWSGVSILYIGICMLLKVIVGRRSITIDFIDGWVLFFGIVVLSTGYKADAHTMGSAMLYGAMISGYFVLSNLLRSEKWITRCLVALNLSAFVVSAVGIANHFWQLGLFFMSEGEDRTAVHYLLVTIPITLVSMLSRATRKGRLGCYFSLIAQIAYLILLGSYTGVIAAVCELLFFFLFYTRKTWTAILLALLALPVVSYWVQPDFSWLWDRATTSTRAQLWAGLGRVFKDAPFSGIGMSDEVLLKALRETMGPQSVDLTQSNTFLRLLVQLGIPGLLLFVVFVLLWYSAGFTLLRKCPPKENNTVLHLGFMASLTGLLLAGNLVYLWSDPRLLLLFWMCAGMARAVRRLAKRYTESDDAYEPTEQRESMNSAEIELTIPKGGEKRERTVAQQDLAE